ncbi:TerL protein [Candidatus Pacearchaeota archaeon]|nr:TerL protein [Candidatus Pacearchaeota archaeon]
MEGFDFKHPDYDLIYTERMKKLGWMDDNPDRIQMLKAHYADNPVDFINDWGMTFDPRNAEINLPTDIPFLLFDKQAEYLNWLMGIWQGREDGVVEKSRDMGVSWLCVAFAAWMWLFRPGTVVGFGSRKEEYVDKIGDPKSLFWKFRFFIDRLPVQLQPVGYSEKKHAAYMRIVNPENDSAVVGEAGDNIGRGNRTSIYFKDESAFYDHAEAIDAALSQTSNCKIDVSTPNGAGNPFYRKAHGGKIAKFVFDWRDDPRKDEAWYQRQCDTLDPIIVAQEIDRNYEGSVANAFIPAESVNAAALRGAFDVVVSGGLRVGVDVARFGDDKTVITFRRGKLLIKQVVMVKSSVTQVAGRVRMEIKTFGEDPEQIAVDTIGIGAGVADMLRGWYPDQFDSNNRRTKIVEDVNCSIRLADGVYYNLRAFMWGEMKEWMVTGSIPNEQELKVDLTALRYGFRGGEILLESKDDAKRRGVKSPDGGDSLALTFAVPTIPRRKSIIPKGKKNKPTVKGMGM